MSTDKENKLATPSVIVGAVGLITGLPGAIIATMLGHKAITVAERTGSGMERSATGALLGWASLGANVAVLIAFFGPLKGKLPGRSSKK